MTNNFCTLFDKNYIFRGLAMYQSLVYHCADFKLWILCMDDSVFEVLTKLNLSHVVLIRLSDLEKDLPTLVEVKSQRTAGEYCWTLSSVFTWYVLNNNPELTMLTYLDSDIYFFSSPASLFDELKDDSILIVRHNYENKLKYQEQRSGIYNVAWVTFKNDSRGQMCLGWWKDACLKWCYNRHEEGKFGDQKYLDDWTARFVGVHVVQHCGADVAPWNINRYDLTEQFDKIFVNGKELIFYHFHSFKMFSPNSFLRHSYFYKFDKHFEDLIYGQYAQTVIAGVKKVNDAFPSFSFGFDRPVSVKEIIRQWAKRIVVYYLGIKI